MSDTKSIRLDQFLKVVGITSSGGQGKTLVQGSHVKVNGEVETRRGRKLRAGDAVEAGGKRVVVEESLLVADEVKS